MQQVYYHETARQQGGARTVGKLAHLTYHSVPFSRAQAHGPVLVGAWLCAWLWLTPLALKLRCLLVAFLYSLIEFSFTYLERGRAYTSVAQFMANVLYAPLLLLQGVAILHHRLSSASPNLRIWKAFR